MLGPPVNPAQHTAYLSVTNPECAPFTGEVLGEGGGGGAEYHTQTFYSFSYKVIIFHYL